jgi:hypothetical protein
MPDAPEAPAHGKGIGGFLNAQTAGLPNWGWILVIVAGIAAAVYLPKMFGKGQSGTSADQAGQGLGLAIDPTTGLPYAVSGLVPAGAGASGSQSVSSLGPTQAAPGAPMLGIIRPGSGAGWDIEHTGIPLTRAPGVSSGQENNAIPFGAQVQVLGAQEGPTSPQNTNIYYQIKYNGKSGYVSSFDLPNVYNANPSWPGGTSQQRIA